MLKTNICVNESSCLYSEECKNLTLERYIEDKGWCCSVGSNCILGNTGALCLECDNENGYFGKDGYCNKCQESWKIELQLIFTILFTLVLIYITVTGIQADQESFVVSRVLRKVFKRVIFFNTDTSSLLKILTNFLQIISLSFQVLNQIPQSLEILIQPFNFIGSLSMQLVSLFECIVP